MRKTGQFYRMMKAADRARRLRAVSTTTSIKKQLKRKKVQFEALKRAIVRALKAVDSAEESVRRIKRRLEDVRLDVTEIRKKIVEAEYTSAYLSVEYDEVLDTSTIHRALDSAKAKRSQARESLTQAKARLELAKSELSALLR